MNFNSKMLVFVLGLVLLSVVPSLSTATTPKRSPAQLAQDEILYARASEMIMLQVLNCGSLRLAQARRPVKVRFFLAGAGQRVTQVEFLGPNPQKGFVKSALTQAIQTCAPYSIPSELESWGGFFVTLNFQ
jgi:hypothetical protein